jgi:hypothetical protein
MRTQRVGRFILVAFVSFASILASCQSPPPGPALSFRDSLGIEIVDFDLDQVPQFGSVEAEPDWVFGELSDRPGGVPLHDVMDAILMGDGGVAVVNRTTQEIFLVDRSGDAWQRIGGRGGGPGEFDFIRSVSEEGGTIGVHDSGHRRWMVFRGGEFLGSRELPRTGVPGVWFPEVVIADGEGLIIGDAYAPPGSPGGVVIRRLVLVARAEGNVVDTIAVIPGETGIDKITGVTPLPFGASYAIVRGDSGVWLGDSALRELSFWSQEGDLERIVRWRSSDDRRLTRQRINALRDRAMEGRPQEIQANIRQNFRDMTFPTQIPAWGTVIRGSDGLLWIGEDPGPEATGLFADPYPAQEWWAIDLEGRPGGRLVSPSGLRVTGFGGDFLIGIHKDSLQVETVRRHRIVKSRGVTGSR